jgi:hypothetical protein
MRFQLHKLLLLGILASCSGDKPSSSDSTSESSRLEPAIATPIPSPATENACEHNGLWAACSVERRLKQSGFVVKKVDEEPQRAGFTIKPVVYSIGKSRLEVFIYDDEQSLARDLQGFDTVAVAPTGTTPTWPSKPTLIRSVNLAAVLLSENSRQAERVILAITAGPPQPGSPR